MFRSCFWHVTSMHHLFSFFLPTATCVGIYANESELQCDCEWSKSIPGDNSSLSSGTWGFACILQFSRISLLCIQHTALRILSVVRIYTLHVITCCLDRFHWRTLTVIFQPVINIMVLLNFDCGGYTFPSFSRSSSSSRRHRLCRQQRSFIDLPCGYQSGETSLLYHLSERFCLSRTSGSDARRCGPFSNILF